MDTKTVNVVASPNVNGNIGSCSIIKETVNVSWLKSQDIAVNSCTGQIIANYTYIDPFGMVVSILLGIFVSFVGLGCGIVIAKRD